MKLGDVTPEARLNSFAQNRERAETQTAALRPWLATLDLGQPTVMVTHQVVISAIAGTSTSSGEIVVLRREHHERPTVQGRIETS